MSRDIVTPRMRVHAWNIHLLAGPDKELFGGLYIPPHNRNLTFRDIIDELRLCFELPLDDETTGGDSSDPWSGIAFGQVDFVNFNPPPIPSDVPTISMYRDEQLNDVLHGLSVSERSAYPIQPPIVRLHVVQHRKCHISVVEPLATHLKAGCANHIVYPSLRPDDRYLPCNKGFWDPSFVSSTQDIKSLPKRPSSDFASPPEFIVSEAEDTKSDEETITIPIPLKMDISVEAAHHTMVAFLASCFVTSSKCAVTGKGRSWCVTPAIGPALQACHIVPPQHYHVYPVPRVVNGQSRYSRTHVRETWNRTWSANNGILLLSHLRELFDARLFSIHPETLRIRVFVPYDVILEYHDMIAQIPPNIDRRALRHHYEMCCIENMAAEMLSTEHQPAYKAEKDKTRTWHKNGNM